MRTRRLTLLSTSIALLAAGLAGPAAAQGPAGVQPSTPSQAAWVVVRSPGAATSTPASGDTGNTTGGTNRVIHQSPGRWQVRFGRIGAGAVPQVVALNTQPRRCQIVKFGRSAARNDSWVNVACFRPDGTPADTRFVATTVRKGTSGDAARMLGLAYADQPSVGGITMPTVRLNSTGGSVTVDRISTGRYYVKFGTSMGSNESIAVATAVSSALQPRACQVVGWGPNLDPAEEVQVRCQDGTGVAADSRFTLLFAVRGGLEGLLRGPNASFWNGLDSAPAPWHPDPTYDYSSAGSAAKIAKVSTGVYRVTLPGMPAGGAAIVNAYTDGLTCQLGSIRTSGTPQNVEVRCFLFDGTTADAEFDFAYTK